MRLTDRCKKIMSYFTENPYFHYSILPLETLGIHHDAQNHLKRKTQKWLLLDELLTHEVRLPPKEIVKERNKEVGPSSTFTVLSRFFEPKGNITQRIKFKEKPRQKNENHGESQMFPKVEYYNENRNFP